MESAPEGSDTQNFSSKEILAVLPLSKDTGGLEYKRTQINESDLQNASRRTNKEHIDATDIVAHTSSVNIFINDVLLDNTLSYDFPDPIILGQMLESEEYSLLSICGESYLESVLMDSL